MCWLRDAVFPSPSHHYQQSKYESYLDYNLIANIKLVFDLTCEEHTHSLSKSHKELMVKSQDPQICAPSIRQVVPDFFSHGWYFSLRLSGSQNLQLEMATNDCKLQTDLRTIIM